MSDVCFRFIVLSIEYCTITWPHEGNKSCLLLLMFIGFFSQQNLIFLYNHWWLSLIWYVFFPNQDLQPIEFKCNLYSNSTTLVWATGKFSGHEYMYIVTSVSQICTLFCYSYTKKYKEQMMNHSDFCCSVQLTQLIKLWKLK